MKKILFSLSLFFLYPFLALQGAHAPGPVKTTVKTALWGIGSALLGYGIKEAVNFSKAHYSLGFPSTVIPTTQSKLLLLSLSCVGLALTTEKIWQERDTSFEPFLPLADVDRKRQVGKAIKYTIATATAYTLLTAAAHQTPLDAAICIASGGFLELAR